MRICKARTVHADLKREGDSRMEGQQRAVLGTVGVVNDSEEQ